MKAKILIEEKPEKKSRPKIEIDYSRSRLSSMETDEHYDDYEHPPDLKICELHGVEN